MIARLSGKLAQKSPQGLIVDVQGVGYRALVSLTAFAALPEEGAPVSLLVHTHMRESAIELFGFVDEGEKALFGELIGVSGVGPRMALTILSGIPSGELVEALAAGDVSRLVRVPGIGKRTAERLIVDLQDRVRGIAAAAPTVAGSAVSPDDEAVSALVNLGYRKGDAEQAVCRAVQGGESDLATLIKEALRQLSG